MTECKYCAEEFSGKKEKLEHELDKHGEEMSGHDKDKKKSELNKLEQQKQTSKHNRKKKIQYSLVGVLILGVAVGGGFYASQNLGTNGVQATNESAGVGTPVHWHADYQLTVCGEDQILSGGPVEAHTHGQTTFHMEGVRQNLEQTQLDWIVDELGGELEADSILGRENCNGQPANLTVKVNGDKIDDHMNYIPRDGDFIRIKYG